MLTGFLGLPWFTWAILALIVAVIYAFVWPQKAATDTTGFRFLILRWGHAFTWLLLAINFMLRGISPSLNGTGNLLALVGGVVYVLFMTSTFVIK